MAKYSFSVQGMKIRIVDNDVNVISGQNDHISLTERVYTEGGNRRWLSLE
jgi:hypothetical protein